MSDVTSKILMRSFTLNPDTFTRVEKAIEELAFKQVEVPSSPAKPLFSSKRHSIGANINKVVSPLQIATASTKVN